MKTNAKIVAGLIIEDTICTGLKQERCKHGTSFLYRKFIETKFPMKK